MASATKVEAQGKEQVRDFIERFADLLGIFRYVWNAEINICSPFRPFSAAGNSHMIEYGLESALRETEGAQELTKKLAFSTYLSFVRSTRRFAAEVEGLEDDAHREYDDHFQIGTGKLHASLKDLANSEPVSDLVSTLNSEFSALTVSDGVFPNILTAVMGGSFLGMQTIFQCYILNQILGDDFDVLRVSHSMSKVSNDHISRVRNGIGMVLENSFPEPAYDFIVDGMFYFDRVFSLRSSRPGCPASIPISRECYGILDAYNQSLRERDRPRVSRKPFNYALVGMVTDYMNGQLEDPRLRARFDERLSEIPLQAKP